VRSSPANFAARAIGWIDWIAARRERGAGLPEHLRTGLAGEEAAFFELRRRGFQVVAQRWNDTPVPGDIDLIAWDRESGLSVLCFVEVKTRTSREVATASVAVDRHKRRMIRRLARHYLRHLAGTAEGDEPRTRFDIVTVYDVPGTPREITLIPGAFGWREEPGE
jgi:putative endonuclease